MQPLFSKYHLLPLLAGVLCLIAAVPAFSEDSLLNKALTHYQKGEYEKALELYDQVGGTDRPAAVEGAARTRVMLGDYEAAEEDLREELPADPTNERLHRPLAELLVRTGRSDEAIRLLEPVANGPTATVCSMVQFGKLLNLHGRRDAARHYFQQAVSYYDRGLVFDAREVACVAEACRWLDRFQDANMLYREAARLDPENPDIQVMWGDLFRDKYNLAEARRSYDQVLKKNRRHVRALVGMARATGGTDARVFLRTALEINPRHVPARVALAGLLMEDGRYAEAAAELNRALQTNPRSVDALAELAALAYLRDDPESFGALEHRLGSFSPGNGGFYARVAEVCGRNYRFQEAAAMAQKAVTLDPDDWNAHIVLGMNLLRLGREAPGRAELEAGFKGDPFHVRAMNMLAVLDRLDGFETRTTEHFVVRMHPQDAAVLWPYLKALLEEGWQRLTAKYEEQPRGPTLIEIFPDQDDFAVRTSGLPDIRHLLGVCFGSVITLNSPKAYDPPNSANWQEVVWHEFTHVITLQMTRNRLPRWLSEGVSVFEEGNGRPEWGRRQDIDLVRAVQVNRLIGIDQLDAAFSKAGTLADVNFAYYESSLLVAFIVERYGFDALKTLIRAYGDTASQNAAFETALHTSSADLETRFFAWLKARVRSINIYVGDGNDADRPRSPDDTRAPSRPDSDSRQRLLVQRLQQQVEAQPRDFRAHLQLGMLLYAAKDLAGAIRQLTTARDLLPAYNASPNPREILARIHEDRGDAATMIRELEDLAAIQANAFGICFKLGRIAAARGDYPRAVRYLERALAVNPYDAEVHRLLGTMALKRADHARAVREFEVLLALDTTDPALANTNLAEAYLRGGDKAQAKRYALAALEIAPLYDRAQEILLDAMAPNGNAGRPRNGTQ